MSDTLHLSGDAFAYAVRLTPTEDGPSYVPNSIYFVAEVGDSLYYRDVGTPNPRSYHPSTMSIRALRPLDVTGAEAQYVWFETEERAHERPDDTTTVTQTAWTGYIFTYDAARGMRYLHKAPIRVERTRNGAFVGSEQWDVSVPEPGIMEVVRRSQRGERVVFAPHEWLRRHVIDTTATDEREMRRTCCR